MWHTPRPMQLIPLHFSEIATCCRWYFERNLLRKRFWSRYLSHIHLCIYNQIRCRCPNQHGNLLGQRNRKSCIVWCLVLGLRRRIMLIFPNTFQVHKMHNRLPKPLSNLWNDNLLVCRRRSCLSCLLTGHTAYLYVTRCKIHWGHKCDQEYKSHTRKHLPRNLCDERLCLVRTICMTFAFVVGHQNPMDNYNTQASMLLR